MGRLFGTLPLLLCRRVEIAIMVGAITTGYRLRVHAASGKIRTVPFAFTNTNKAGSAGNAGIRLVGAGSTYLTVAGRGRSTKSSGARCIERDNELPRGRALPSPAPQRHRHDTRERLAWIARRRILDERAEGQVTKIGRDAGRKWVTDIGRTGHENWMREGRGQGHGFWTAAGWAGAWLRGGRGFGSGLGRGRARLGRRRGRCGAARGAANATFAAGGRGWLGGGCRVLR